MTYGKSMTTSVTLAVMGAILAAGLFFGWRGARPPNLSRGPRMIPWRWLMLLCAAAELILLIHLLANLKGL